MRMASARFEVAIQHVFKEKDSYNMAVRGLSGVGLVMVGGTRAFGGSVRVTAAFMS